MSFAGHVLMITLGTWITAAGLTYTFAPRRPALATR